jgi:hypothetical protein
MLLRFIGGLRGDVRVTLKKGPGAAWSYDLLKPHVSEVVVCNLAPARAADGCQRKAGRRKPGF